MDLFAYLHKTPKRGMSEGGRAIRGELHKDAGAKNEQRRTSYSRNATSGACSELNADPNSYFLFMNTQKFYEHPRIIYLDINIDLEYKVKFINTCDAMIHARAMGETFGLAVAEFSMKNKPIITCRCGDLAHIDILGDRAIVYNSTEELVRIFTNARSIIESRSDWNAYRAYSPERVIGLFQKYIFSKA